MNREKQYQANPVVSCADEEEGGLLFNADTGDSSVVNLSGRDLYLFLGTPRTAAELAAYLLKRYRGVTPEEASRDVKRFIETLTPDFLRVKKEVYK